MKKKITSNLFLVFSVTVLWILGGASFTFVSAQEVVFKANEQPASLALTYEERSFLEMKKQITMCVDPDWNEGITADHMTLIPSILPAPLVMIPTKTWSESIDYAIARKCDIFSLAMATPEREANMNLTRPYLHIPLVMVAKMDHPFVDDITAITDQKWGREPSLL